MLLCFSDTEREKERRKEEVFCCWFCRLVAGCFWGLRRARTRYTWRCCYTECHRRCSCSWLRWWQPGSMPMTMPIQCERSRRKSRSEREGKRKQRQHRGSRSPSGSKRNLWKFNLIYTSNGSKMVGLLGCRLSSRAARVREIFVQTLD